MLARLISGLALGVIVLNVLATVSYGQVQKGDDSLMTWRHLSSKTGDLPAPNAGPQQTACLVLDVDRDGVNDFVLAERTQGPSVVWYRRGKTGWTKYVLDADALPIEAGGAVCDIDGDGDLDIVFGEDWRGNKVYCWENPWPNFDPTVPWKRHVIKAEGANQHHDQVFGDFDSDGKPELVFWNQRAKKLFWAKIPADPRAGPWPYVPIFEGAGEGLAQGDVDGDGKVELLAGGRWFKHKGGADFVAYRIDPSHTHPRMAVGDLNGDGRLEVVMSPSDSVGRLKWYECKGDPRDPIAWIGHDLLDQDAVHGHSLAVADINRDGHLDIFCAEMARWTLKAPSPDNPNAKAWIFYGDGKGRFAKTELVTGHGFHEAKVADLDGDGRLDILNKPFAWDTPRVDVWLQRR